MMLSKPKPSDDEIVEEQPTLEMPAEILDTDEKQAEIERRLAMLGIADEPEKEPEPTPAPDQEPEPVEVKEPKAPVVPAPVVEMTAPEEPKVVVEEAKPEPVKEPVPEPVKAAPKPVAAASSAKSNKSALLARIMAAQERAKQAQLKQAAQEQPESVQFEKEKMLKALNGISDEDTKKKEEPLSMSSFKAPSMPPPPMPTMTMEKSGKPAPPSFEMFEMQMNQQPMMMAPPPPAPTMMAPPSMAMPMAPPTQAAPPAFDSISLDIFEAPTASAPPSAPSAPPVEAVAQPSADFLSDFGGIMPVAPPPMQQEENVDDVCDYDFDGNQLSHVEKARMIEEQRAIMEQIAKEASNEKTSMAAIKADAFANRMAGNGPVAAGVDGFSASDVEEQRRIMEQIEAAAKQKSEEEPSVATSSVDISSRMTCNISAVAGVDGFSASEVEEQRRIMDRIESAAKPKSPNLVISKEEILQMEEDRKLAEALQAEDYGAAGDDGASEYPANRSRQRTAAAGAAAAGSAEKSWWDSISDTLDSYVNGEPEIDESKRSAEIGENRGTYSPTRLHSVTTGEEGDERVGLMEGGGGGDYPAARVAQGKPLFSCVVDSISNTANMMLGEQDEEVHGVDTTSFLTTPNVGRNRNEPAGKYYAVPEHD
uniref:Uncharacterized protein n=1 Tax=Chaetoceros debilis TaxID=122233 RepID=A0A7S3Q3S0_9STRA